MAQGSKKAVVLAITGNAVITVLKFFAATLTHSASMMNEAVHSLMDTVNQLFLLMGLRSAEQPIDTQYAFGHGQKKYLWNLWSAIGLFSIGAGLGFAHAWHSYHALESGEAPGNALIHFFGFGIDPIVISMVVLLIAFVVEAYVLLVAVQEFKRRMRDDNETHFWIALTKSDDPTLLAVLLEDSVAVFGVVMAAIGIGLARVTGNPVWDILFSVIIALILAIVAVLLGMINMRYLTDIRDVEAEDSFREVVSNHREVERWHDLRSVIIDEAHTVLVAEIELREEVLLSNLRGRIDAIYEGFIEQVPNHRRDDIAVQQYLQTRATVQATLERTEQVVDKLERDIRDRCPQVFHVTLEVEGFAETTNLKTV
jgi:solute carrier family 30 (zinc transporter), member 9